MKSHVRDATRFAGLILICTSTGWGAANPPPRLAGQATGSPVDPAQIIQQAGELLRSAKSLRADVTVNCPIKIHGRSQPSMLRYTAALRRPGSLAVVQKTALPSLTVVCDGEQYFTFNPGQMKYSVREAPSLPNASVGEDLRQACSGAGTALAWALEDKPAEAIMEGTKSVKHRGIDATAGARCHHLVFEEGGWVREIWVEAGEKPLIRRISWSRAAGQAGGPPKKAEYVVTFANWSIDGDLAAETFRFTPPEGAKRVEDSDLREAMKSPAHGLKGQAAPICVLPLLSGGQLNLAKLKGNIVVLDFWATWCPPCRKGLPILDEIASEYKDKGVQVYAINCNEAPAQVRQFVTSTNLQLPVAMDAGKTVGGRYSVQGIPQTVIIDKDGIVRCVHVGLPGNAKQAFMTTLDALLAGQDIAPDASQGDGEAVTSPGEQ